MDKALRCGNSYKSYSLMTKKYHEFGNSKLAKTEIKC